MTSDDWFAVAIVWFLVVGVALLNRQPNADDDQNRRDRAEWQRTAAEAARSEDDVHRDAAAHRAGRTAPAIDSEPGDPYSDDRINAELCFIPHQTRRTEEDQ